MCARTANATASGHGCGPEMRKSILIFCKERHFNCIKVISYVGIPCFQAHLLHLLNGAGGISGWGQGGGQTTGLGAGPYLAHVQQPALFSLVYEAMDDEPGLPVCLKI